MTRQECISLHDKVDGVLPEVLEKFGLIFLSSIAKYSSGDDFTLTIKSVKKSNVKKVVTDQDIHDLVAPPNTLVWAEWERGDYWLARILEYRPRSSAYIIEYVDDDGSKWKMPASRLFITHPITKEPLEQE